MKRTPIQVRITKGEKQFVAECLDLPVVTQAPTLPELAHNIQEAISLHLEGELGCMECVANNGVDASLEIGKKYASVKDSDADASGLIRVIDESGEDYLYPAGFFAPGPRD